MVKSSGGSISFLASIGGLAVLLLAARITVPMPMGLEATSLLSVAALLIGVLVGEGEGLSIGLLYFGAVVVGLPEFISNGHLGMENPFALHASGMLVGLALGAGLAGRIAPKAQGNLLKLLGALLAGHAIALALNALWLMRFEPWHHALYAGIIPHLIPAAAKSAGGAVLALVLRRFV